MTTQVTGLKIKTNLVRKYELPSKAHCLVKTDPEELGKTLGTVIYNRKRLYNLAIKSQGAEAKLKQVVRAYKYIIKNNNIAANIEVTFTIVWNISVHKRYRCSTTGDKITIVLLKNRKHETVTWPLEKKQRVFQLYHEDKYVGRYVGTQIKNIAAKAFAGLLRRRKDIKPGAEVDFTIKECTRVSNNRYYHYTGQKKQLACPNIVKVGKGDNQKTIEFKHEIKIKKRDCLYDMLFFKNAL